MRLAHVLVCHSVTPVKLFESIPHNPDSRWYVFLHSDDKGVEDYVSTAVRERDGNLFSYKSNRGLSKSWNEGIHLAIEADCEAFLLLNDDLFFYDGAYEKFRETIETTIHNDENIFLVTLNGLESGASPHAGETITQWFSCGAITKYAVNRIGYFDQNFRPAYFEDIDYARRASLTGMQSHIDQRTLVEHERSSTIRLLQSQKKPAVTTGFGVNRDYFERKWGGSGGQERFLTPFEHSAFGVSIPYTQRDLPYGPEFDQDLGFTYEIASLTEQGEKLVSSDELARIATNHGTDKWNGHWYAGPYATHLEYLRTRQFNLLEIGVGGYDDPHTGGHSLRAWKEYFPLATIIGLDIHDKRALAEDRIKIYQGSQSSPIAIAEMVKDFPDGIDVIIDDGSHRHEHVLASFIMLWQFVKKDGWYIIEDLQTSYWPNHGGKLYDTNSATTTVGFLKSLIDGLNWQEMHQPTYNPSDLDATISGIHFYHNIVFINKGGNIEGSTEVVQNRIRGV